MAAIKSRWIRWALQALAVATCIALGIGTSERVHAVDEAIVDPAEIVFIGTLVEKGAAATADVKAAPETASVMVEEMLRPEAPSPLAEYQGRTVTVRLIDPDALSPGDQATFYARIWRIGKGLAVIELGHEDLVASAVRSGEAMDRARAAARGEFAAHADRDLHRRMESAAVVLSGRVKAVREPIEPERAAGEVPRRRTEHDPMWREAVIEVDEGIKGVRANTVEVTVRFSASQDILWLEAPKFEVGQEGVFILDPEEVAGQSATRSEPGEPAAGILVNPRNFLPKDQIERVRRLSRP